MRFYMFYVVFNIFWWVEISSWESNSANMEKLNLSLLIFAFSPKPLKHNYAESIFEQQQIWPPRAGNVEAGKCHWSLLIFTFSPQPIKTLYTESIFEQQQIWPPRAGNVEAERCHWSSLIFAFSPKPLKHITPRAFLSRSKSDRRGREMWRPTNATGPG